MKKVLALLLVLTLGLALVACGNSAEGQVTAFHPETPEDFLETVLGDLNGRYSYHRRSEAYPDKPEREGIVDVFFEEIGTAEQTVSGTITNKKSKGSWIIYGKGNLFSRAATEGTSVTYRNLGDGKIPSLYEPCNSPLELCVLRGKLEENFLDGTVRDYLTDEATLTVEEDGSYTLTVPLGTEALYQLGEFSSRGDAHEYISPSDVIYKADKTGTLTSLEMGREVNGKPFRVLRVDFSYAPAENKKPAWFNEEDPLNSEGERKAKLIYHLENKHTITLSKDGEKLTATVSRGDPENKIVKIPSFIPTEIRYDAGIGIPSEKKIILKKWTPETEIHKNERETFFFKEGTRPAENTQKNVFFEGEWEMKNGEPTPIQ